MSRILFCCGRNYLPQGFGGIQINTDALCRRLQDRGHHVAVLAGLERDELWPFLRLASCRLLGRPASTDRVMGYSVYRAYHPNKAFEWVLSLEKPDFIVVQSIHMGHYGRIARNAGIPCFAYFLSAWPYDLGADSAGNLTGFLALSKYLARWIHEQFGQSSQVILPVIEKERFRTNSSQQRVLLVNPHPEKGGMLVVELARHFPHVEFDFVECWYPGEALASVRVMASTMPNIHWHPPTFDLRQHIGLAKVLLFPSRETEGWGRIASEVQVSGIPVLATDIGGVSEAVGRGGIMFAVSDGVDRWAAELSDVLINADRYDALSRAALQHSERPELAPDFVVDQFIAALHAGSS